MGSAHEAICELCDRRLLPHEAVHSIASFEAISDADLRARDEHLVRAKPRPAECMIASWRFTRSFVTLCASMSTRDPDYEGDLSPFVGNVSVESNCAADDYIRVTDHAHCGFASKTWLVAAGETSQSGDGH